MTDALGRLIEVYEDPNGLNYPTTYNYDVLDNLVKVIQGSQERFFMYDSLKRLIRVRNPEQDTLASLNLSDPLTLNSTWSIGYQYDANSNLTVKTDPRGVVTDNSYDALNRVTTILYRINGQPDPNTGDVQYLYDNATNGKGRLWLTYKWGAKPHHTAVGLYDPLGRVTQFYNLFGDGQGGWSTGYEINRTYDRAGNITSQTYPSGHTVTYSHDSAGRLSSFAGNLGDGVSRTYSSSFVYNARNQMTRELFGTQTALYHKLEYNIRGQLWDVRVGTDTSGSWNRGALQFFYDGTYGYGTSGPDNNGNVLKSKQYVPLDDSSSTWAIHEQAYSYDALNRLGSAAEYFVSSSQSQTQTSLQSYTYDRWGNRTINTASWGTDINETQFTVDTATNRLGVPGGQSGAMSYDNAGNLISDTYTGAGARVYDAENRITAAADKMGQTSYYMYNAAGHRTRRQVAGGQEVWQIYGIDGELVAEYPANGAVAKPVKEYGYRNGQLLITAEPPRTNVALASNGATATASSQYSGNYPASSTINGDRRGLNWNNGGGWNDAAPANTFPDWLQIDFNGNKTIDEISVFTVQDSPGTPAEPTESMTFTLYGLTAYSVQYWNGSSWTTVPGGSVTGNNKVWRKFTFSAITTSKIRVLTNASVDGYSRLTEVEAFGPTETGAGEVKWLVADHLGTPRIIIDQTGSRANVKRHDYLPFGEELFAGSGGRTAALGYTGDGVRQQFTSKERDVETGLDYFLARYYGSTQGRFLSPDPLNPMVSASSDTQGEALFLRYIAEPANWNKYTYVYNNPLRRIDPDGRFPQQLAPTHVVTTLVKYSRTSLIAQQLAMKLVRASLDWVFGTSPEVRPGALQQHEVDFAKQVTKFTGYTFIGMPTKNEPGIDGIMTGSGGLSDIKGVASLTETERSNPRVLIDLAQDKEASAKKAGYKQVDLFIKAKALDSGTVSDYVKQGSAITDVASAGTIRSISIFTSDNKVVKVEGQTVTTIAQ